jgi:hypothetical protein
VNLAQKYRDTKILVWDAFIRYWDPERLARALTQASSEVKKVPFTVIVESHTKYGNARAFALEYAKSNSADDYLFLAHDQSSLNWANEHGLNAAVFSTRSGSGQAALWDSLLRAAVSVYESHDFWRSQRAMQQRALLSGSHRIQLWHGSTGPIGKEIGMGRLRAQPAFWHFTALATTSVGWDELVCEPNSDEARRLDRVQASASIHDIEFRLVDVLRAGEYVSPKNRRLAVTPTFPETANGEVEIVKWLAELGKAALVQQCEVDVYLHPSSKPSLRKAVSNMSGITLENSGFNSAKLRDYSAIVTDFSSIAHDALLIGAPVVMVTVDLEEYQKSREILIDQEQWDAAYVVEYADGFAAMLQDLFGQDSRKAKRQAYREDLLAALPGAPGEPTLNAVKRVLSRIS